MSPSKMKFIAGLDQRLEALRGNMKDGSKQELWDEYLKSRPVTEVILDIDYLGQLLADAYKESTGEGSGSYWRLLASTLCVGLTDFLVHSEQFLIDNFPE